jgi:hypothetical protein
MLQAEIGVGVKKALENKAQQMAGDAEVKPLAAHGAIGNGRRGSDRTSTRGETAEYLVRRLKRDAPEIAQRLARGEYPSARAAATAVSPVEEDGLASCRSSLSFLAILESASLYPK